jgi:NDP-sugar pyrophosphorylase family protein
MGGVYIFNRLLLNYLTPTCSLERDVMPILADARQLRGTLGTGYFCDIGVPEGLQSAKRELSQACRGRLFFSLLRPYAP